jgi:predicted DCC family thiol-disulfide oxidoreductase YuxK
MSDLTVVYDGACKVCIRLVGILGRWDRHKRLEIIPSSTMGLHDRFPSITRSDYMASIQVIRPDGTRFQNADALEQLVKVLPGGWLLSWMFKVPGIKGLIDRFYRWFARNRYHFGCGDACPIRKQQDEAKARSA